MHTTSSRDTIPDTLLKSAYQVGTSTHSFAPQAMLRLVMLELLIESMVIRCIDIRLVGSEVVVIVYTFTVLIEKRDNRTFRPDDVPTTAPVQCRQ